MDQNINPTEKNSGKKIFAFILLSLSAYLALKALLSVVFVPELWGLNLLHYLPLWITLLLTSVSFLGIYIGAKLSTKPKSIPAKKREKGKSGKAGKQWRLSDMQTLILLILVFGTLFLVFHIAYPFLGDSTTYLGVLYNIEAFGKIYTQRTATPVLFLLYGIDYLYVKLSHHQLNLLFPFTVVSFISGMLFVIFSFSFARAFDKDIGIRILFFSLLISLGGSLLFFGYVEMYALQYSCMLIYLYLSFLYLQNKAKLSTVAFMMCICIGFHLQNFLLLPSFLFLYSLRDTEDRQNADRRKAVARSLLIAIPLMLSVYALSQLDLLGIPASDPTNLFIQLKPSDHSFYTLFSGIHLFDILNHHFLIAAVPVLIIVSCLAGGFRSIRWGDPYLLFLLVNLFFFESFLIGGDLDLGLGRDWDVCASIGITLALISTILLKQVIGTNLNTKAFIIPIMVVTLCSAITWIALNGNKKASSSRYEDLLEYYIPVLDKQIALTGYEHLRKYFVREDIDGELRTIRKMMEIRPRHFEARAAFLFSQTNADALSAVSKAELLRITKTIALCNDSVLTEEIFDKLRVAEPHSGDNVTLGDYYESFISFLYKTMGYLPLNEALDMTKEFISKHPSLPYGYELLGYERMMYEDDIPTAIPYIEKALSFDTLRARPHLYLALAYSHSDRNNEANEHFQSAFKQDPKWLRGIVLYGFFLIKLNADAVHIADIEWVRQLLKNIINTPAESSLEDHIAEHNERVATSQQMLSRIEQRLQELRANHEK